MTCHLIAPLLLRGRLLGRAVGDLVVRVDAADEQLAVPINHLRDPQAFDNVRADADDLHDRRSDVPA